MVWPDYPPDLLSVDEYTAMLVISPFGAGPEGVSGVPRIIERSSMESPYCRKQKTSPQAGFFK
ncbi:TPA: hypothetical protein ACNU0I_000331, partial [Raoultella ornithinolytica]